MYRKLSEELKGKILGFKDAGWTIKKISTQMKIPYSTVGFITKGYSDCGTIKRKYSSGRRKILNDQNLNVLRDI